MLAGVLQPTNERIEIVFNEVQHMMHLVEDLRTLSLPDGFRHDDRSGLGLPIVKSVVELHGGSIQVVSEGKGKGSLFSIRLPPPQIRSKPILLYL